MTPADRLARIYKMTFSSVYPLYIQKAEKKGRTKEEVDKIITWLTGYTTAKMEKVLKENHDFETFFNNAPKMNPNADKITGMICGYRVEEIKDDIERKMRYLDKMIDELAKGKDIEKILRK
jgi:hypothetical protein